MKKSIKLFLSATVLLAAASIASKLGAEIVTIKLPSDTASFKVAPGSSVASGNCLTCHSAEYVTTQPPLSLKAWTAEVNKMRKLYGAPIAENQVPVIAAYLAVNYGTETNTQAVAQAQQAAAPAGEMSAEKMATIYGCLACHKQDVKVVGPAFKDVRAKYLHNPDAIEKIVYQIHHGGTGKWGTAVMPAFTAVSNAEAERLAKWIMSGDGTK